MDDKLHNWMSFINNPNGEDIESMAMVDKDIKSAKDTLSVMSGNSRENYIIRPIGSNEIYLLEDFLYEAIFQRDENNLLPRDVINDPMLKVYIEGFGKRDDFCLVAEVKSTIVGAVWTRVINGYGSVDSITPEFAISLYKDYRGLGIGTELMIRMLQVLRENGYKKTSLAVQKDNYAFNMYKNIGFEIIDENEEEYIMVYHL